MTVKPMLNMGGGVTDEAFSLDDARTLVADHIARVTPHQWEQLLATAREALGQAPGEWRGGETMVRDGQTFVTAPHFATSKALTSLIMTLSRRELIVPFNWVAWQQSGDFSRVIQDDVAAIMHLTASVRRGRFVEGGIERDVTSKLWTEAFDVLARTHGG